MASPVRAVLVSVGSAGCVVCYFFAPDDDGRGCDFCFSLCVGVFFLSHCIPGDVVADGRPVLQFTFEHHLSSGASSSGA